MLERENKNSNKIYLYAYSDAGDFLYNAYEFSAYLLTKLFDTLELKKEVKPESGITLYVVHLTPEFVVEQFLGPNATVGDLFIKVVLDSPALCIRWKGEFKELKNKWQGKHAGMHPNGSF